MGSKERGLCRTDPTNLFPTPKESWGQNRQPHPGGTVETCRTLQPMASPSGKQRTMPSVQLTLNSLEITVFFLAA